MNDKIKELVYQTGYILDSDNENTGMPVDGEFVKKFAELIVKACADYADMAYDARCKYPGDYVGEAMGYGVEGGITKWRMQD